MNYAPTQTRLHGQLAAMAALERAIAQESGSHKDAAGQHPEVAGLLADIGRRATSHHEALAGRLHTVAADLPVPESAAPALATAAVYHTGAYATSAALVNLSTLLHLALAGYSVLMVLDRRASDSVVRGPDNTDDIVREHMTDWTAVLQQVLRALPYAVVSELEHAGEECQCTCPSCSLGVCLCAVSIPYMLDLAWTAAGPGYIPGGMTMVRPRSGSAAADAGLHGGDVVTAVDGKPIESIPMLQQAIRGHEPDEAIHFSVRQGSDLESDVVVKRA